MIAAIMLPAPPARAVAEDKIEETVSLHYQATAVFQRHGGFTAPYSGNNSLSPRFEAKNSYTTTLFAGARLWDGGEVYFNPEIAFGRGLSNVTGIAGFPNGEISRVSGPDPTLYRARLFLRQTFGLGGEKEYVEPDQNQRAGWQDASRVVLTVGNLSALDIFDDNAYTQDPRAHFMNWALMANGAWDYPADARGYSWGAAIEYIRPGWALRAGSLLMPKTANGLPLDYKIASAHGDVVELERSYALLGQAGKFRLMAYVNHAHMGSYRSAIDDPSAGLDIASTRQYRTKRGFGMNIEQGLTENAGAFLRAGWNDGKTETFAFTEIDRTVSGGASINGKGWERPKDTLGIAGVLNGLSRDHRDYLAAGGLGFIIGDGRLSYGSERIAEIYYSLEAAKGISISLDYQHVVNPAYNRDRGPVTIWSTRVHYEF